MKKSECARPSTPDTGTVGPLGDLLLKWREDAGGTDQAWFLWEERLKKLPIHMTRDRRGGQRNRRGPLSGTYTGSSLETVARSIAE